MKDQLFKVLIVSTILLCPLELWANCKSKEAQAHTKAGLLAYEQQDCATTLNELSQSVGLDCKDPIIFFRMALCSEVSGSTYSAKQYYQLAEPLFNKNKSSLARDFYFAFGRFLYTQKNWDESLKYLNQSTLLGENSFSVYYLMADIMLSKNDLNQAAAYFNQALQSDTSQVGSNELGKAHKALLVVAYQSKDYERAKNELQLCKKLLPGDKELKNYELNINLAVQQIKIGDMLNQIESRRAR